ncbi:hypothetical protein GCM10009625_12070 [Brachybacterium fresconis]
MPAPCPAAIPADRCREMTARALLRRGIESPGPRPSAPSGPCDTHRCTDGASRPGEHRERNGGLSKRQDAAIGTIAPVGADSSPDAAIGTVSPVGADGSLDTAVGAIAPMAQRTP